MDIEDTDITGKSCTVQQTKACITDVQYICL